MRLENAPSTISCSISSTVFKLYFVFVSGLIKISFPKFPGVECHDYDGVEEDTYSLEENLFVLFAKRRGVFSDVILGNTTGKKKERKNIRK